MPPVSPSVVRLLGPDDAAAYWSLRLEALEREPTAFGASAAEHRATTIADAAARLGDAQTSVLGLVVADGTPAGQLRGMAGLAREARPKTRHKAFVWGVYVGAELRGVGHGRALMRELIAHARTLQGLERLTLTVTTTQSAALALYQALGFTAWGCEPNALKLDARYVDEHYLTLPL